MLRRLHGLLSASTDTTRRAVWESPFHKTLFLFQTSAAAREHINIGKDGTAATNRNDLVGASKVKCHTPQPEGRDDILNTKPDKSFKDVSKAMFYLSD